MKARLIHTDVRVAPPFPLQVVASVNDQVLRVEIDWPTIEHLIGALPATADAVREFLHENRHAIEIAIEAHVFAHGLPLAGQLVLTLEDLNRLLPIRSDPTAYSASAYRAP